MPKNSIGSHQMSSAVDACLCTLLVAIMLCLPAQAESIKFNSLDGAFSVSAELTLPPGINTGKWPAVVIVHGTGGIDERTNWFEQELPKLGIATFKVDFKTGIFKTAQNRPLNDRFLSASFAALKLLQDHGQIDPKKIGFIGFSLGGHQALTTALTDNKTRWINERDGFAAHVSFYGGCKFFLRKLTSNSRITAPMQLHWGSLDSFEDEEFCPKVPLAVAHKTIELFSYEGTHHGFDGLNNGSYAEPNVVGKLAVFQANPAAAQLARSRSLTFFKQHLLQP
jgi:dienelactone hydrolase